MSSRGGTADTSRGGVWLLDLIWSGRVLRFATRPVEVASSELGTTCAYADGLPVLSVDVDLESLSVDVSSDLDWGALRRRAGPLIGCSAVLRYWLPGQSLEGCYTALRGLIDGAAWGDTEAPGQLAVSIRQDTDDTTLIMINEAAVVGEDSWNTTDRDVGLDGAGYPIILGYPGRGDHGASPALYVSNTDQRVLIAGHHVDAATVTIYDLTGGAIDTTAVINTTDDQNRSVAMADLTATTITAAKGRSYFASWSPSAGATTMLNGSPVAGLGDVLLWGALTYGNGAYDLSEIQGRRAALNRYAIDSCVNEPGVRWGEWVRDNLLGLFDLEIVQGRHGKFYRQIRYRASPADVVATLSAMAGVGGLRVRRVGPIAEDDEEIVNRVIVAYGAVGGDEPAARVTLAGARGQAADGGSDLDTVYPDRRCRRSESLYGRREREWAATVTADAATALLIGQDKADRHALPKPLATYEGGTDLLRLRKQDTVRLYDDRAGADFAGDLALVRQIRILDSGTVQIALMIDTDHGPEL